MTIPIKNERDLLAQHVWVAIDLETTGLSTTKDRVIEIGAVKFDGHHVIDTFETFVNPLCELDPFIKNFTGIDQYDVDSAPIFQEISDALCNFIGSSTIVGHNISFDLGFLKKAGLSLPNPSCDTWDMAYVLLPTLRQYSLATIASALDVSHDNPHRALGDAKATSEIFLRLLDKLCELNHFALTELSRITNRSRWDFGYLVDLVLTYRPLHLTADTTSDPAGLRLARLRSKLTAIESINKRADNSESMVTKHMPSIFQLDGALGTTISDFEERPQQIKMAQQVSSAIREGRRLIVEAGTGVGKSFAYLLPALIHAYENGKRIVISTNTINLQEQLVGKDIPLIVDTLSSTDIVSADRLHFMALKGRSNYLCLRRWDRFRLSDTLNLGEAKMLAKTLVWLQTTSTGDRSELSLGRLSRAPYWERLSSQGVMDCRGHEKVCFLKGARERAGISHIVVVNHSLLLSDAINGGGIIPPYDILIVDEAHHLEDQATNHLGFSISQVDFDSQLAKFNTENGILPRILLATRMLPPSNAHGTIIKKLIEGIESEIHRVHQNVSGLFRSLGAIISPDCKDNIESLVQFRITAATRHGPAWSQLEVQWANIDILLQELTALLTNLSVCGRETQETQATYLEEIAAELASEVRNTETLRHQLAEFIEEPRNGNVYWATSPPNREGYSLNAAPMQVGDALESLLYSKKESVVLTGATMSTAGSFEHFLQRVGFGGADQLILDSPFDYKKAALLCIPQDMPEPNSHPYQEALHNAICDTTIAAGGRTLCLFTSYSAMNAAAHGIRNKMRECGYTVLAQGIDGTPHQLLNRFHANPDSVLLGTASFWEGIDLPGDSLRVIIMPRLPFNVPTEPMFAARSEMYENPFTEYAIPQAILRFRQGFGRLIRSQQDRGVVVVLDSRIKNRQYGIQFIESIPPVTTQTVNLVDLSQNIREWLG